MFTSCYSFGFTVFTAQFHRITVPLLWPQCQAAAISSVSAMIKVFQNLWVTRQHEASKSIAAFTAVFSEMEISLFLQWIVLFFSRNSFCSGTANAPKMFWPVLGIFLCVCLLISKVGVKMKFWFLAYMLPPGIISVPKPLQQAVAHWGFNQHCHPYAQRIYKYI